MGKKLLNRIVKEIEEHNKKEGTAKVVAHFILLLNKNEEGGYTFDGGIVDGKILEEKRRLASALSMLSERIPAVRNLVMNAAVYLSRKYVPHTQPKLTNKDLN